MIMMANATLQLANPEALAVVTDVLSLDYIGSADRGEMKMVVVATDPARTVLYGELRFSWPSWEDAVHIEYIEVDPAFRRRGVGTAMYDALYAWAAHERVSVEHGMTTPEGEASLQAWQQRRKASSANPKRKKNARPAKLFHGTSRVQLERLLAAPTAASLYLADVEEKAWNYAEQQAVNDDSAPAMLIVRARIMPGSWEEDVGSEYEQEFDLGQWIYTGALPRKAIAAAFYVDVEGENVSLLGKKRALNPKRKKNANPGIRDLNPPPHTHVAAAPVADPYEGLPSGKRPRAIWRTPTHAFELVHETRAQHAAKGYQPISWWSLRDLDLEGEEIIGWHTRRKVLRWLALHHPDGAWEILPRRNPHQPASVVPLLDPQIVQMLWHLVRAGGMIPVGNHWVYEGLVNWGLAACDPRVCIVTEYGREVWAYIEQHRPDLLSNPIPNVLAPTGPGRPWPAHAGQTAQGYDLWTYRGREIEIIARPDGFQYAIIERHVPGVGQRHLVQRARSPDPQASLQAAVFDIDKQEAVRARPELAATAELVASAIEMVVHKGQPLTRANVTRQIEIWRAPKTSYYGEVVQVFEKLPLPERIELVDESIRVAQSHGGRWPNPVIAPSGPLRPWPQWIGTTSEGSDVWGYRGHEIVIIPVSTPGHFRWSVRTPTGGGFTTPVASPDPAAALQSAVFEVDLVLAPLDHQIAAGFVIAAAHRLRSIEGKPVDRSNVARTAEVMRQQSTMPRHVAAFQKLSIQQRLELIDEVVRVAQSHGGRFPNPSREYNVVRPKGAMRPVPQWIGQARQGAEIWSYRGRIVEIYNPPSTWPSTTTVPYMTGLVPGFRHVIFDQSGVMVDPQAHPSPDAAATLRLAVWKIDLREASDARPALWDAAIAVEYAITHAAKALRPGQALTRAAVAREIKLLPKTGMIGYPEWDVKVYVAAFDALPVSERLELVDEMIDLANMHGGRFVNPKHGKKKGKRGRGRQRNVVAPKGAGRPFPQYLYGLPQGGSAWGYRGWLVEIFPQPAGGYRFIASVPGQVWRSSGFTGVLQQVFHYSPDEHASLQAAVFHIDLDELIGQRPEVFDAYAVVLHAMDKLHRRGDPLDRATLARMIEMIRRTKTDEMHHFAPRFYALPNKERIELLDEMIALARSHGNRFPMA